MDAQVAGQLGMEAGDPGPPLARQHRMPVVLREDLHGRAGRLDARSPDEHPRKAAAAERGHVEHRLERVALTPVRVAADRDVDPAERALVGAAVEHVTREEDHPGAGAEHREAVVEAPGQRGADAGRVEQPADRGRFAARDHDRIQRAEILGNPHLDGVRAEGLERLTVLPERPLEREQTYFHDLEAASRSPAALGELDVEGRDLGAAHRRAEPA